MARCQVVCQKQDADGNPIGRSNQNSILDISLYEADILGERLQSWLQTSCRVNVCPMWFDGNQYLLLEAFVDHRKNGSTLSVEDQMIVDKGEKPLESQQLAGTIVVKGKMGPNCGRSYSISKSHTQSMLQNMP